MGLPFCGGLCGAGANLSDWGQSLGGPRGQMLAKVRCLGHLPDTNFGSFLQASIVPATPWVQIQLKYQFRLSLSSFPACLVMLAFPIAHCDPAPNSCQARIWLVPQRKGLVKRNNGTIPWIVDLTPSNHIHVWPKSSRATISNCHCDTSYMGRLSTF